MKDHASGAGPRNISEILTQSRLSGLARRVSADRKKVSNGILLVLASHHRRSAILHIAHHPRRWPYRTREGTIYAPKSSLPLNAGARSFSLPGSRSSSPIGIYRYWNESASQRYLRVVFTPGVSEPKWLGRCQTGVLSQLIAKLTSGRIRRTRRGRCLFSFCRYTTIRGDSRDVPSAHAPTAPSS